MKLEKIYLWGSGVVSDRILSAIEKQIPNVYENDLFSIVAIIDNDASKWGKIFHSKKIVSFKEANENGFDRIIILIENETDVKNQIKILNNIPETKIKGKWELLRLLLLLKYRDSKEEEISKTVEYLKSNDLSLFNNWLPARKLQEVMWDYDINMPYVFYTDIIGVKRKMYFPWQLGNRFQVIDGKPFYWDVNYEQQPGSPHLYTYLGHDIKEGDVVIDGGVCEGNFSLKYAAIVKKLYLFEPDEFWAKANYFTFRDFGDKIIRLKKMLYRRDNDNAITIDSLNLDRLDFLKLDVEGAELDALIGAQDTLNRNNVSISVCTYHCKEDAVQIKSYLDFLGYKSSYSKGNMVFTFDNNIWNTLDIRKCLIYANKSPK